MSCWQQLFEPGCGVKGMRDPSQCLYMASICSRKLLFMFEYEGIFITKCLTKIHGWLTVLAPVSDLVASRQDYSLKLTLNFCL